MSHELIGTAANLVGLLIPLIFSFTISRTYSRPYFSSWTASYLFYTLSVVLLALPDVATQLPLTLATIAVYAAGTGFLLKTARALRPEAALAPYYTPFVIASAGLTGLLSLV